MNAVAFSPDGRTLAAVDDPHPMKPKAVALWEVTSGKERGRLDIPNVFGVMAFSPDGRLLAGANAIELRLFHLISGQELACVDLDLGISSLAFSPDGKLLAAAGWANTALIFDVGALSAGKLPKAAKLGAKELDVLWDDLRGADGPKAYRAVGLLAASPTESLPYLKARLKPAPGPDPTAPSIAALIADLDSDDFQTREKASATLARLGKKAEAALTQAIEKADSAEVRARARRLLEKIQDVGDLPSEDLISLRALEAMANCGTPEARDAVAELAKGDADARLTQEAKATLKRLRGRKATAP
jgi:hypothetical protein